MPSSSPHIWWTVSTGHSSSRSSSSSRSTGSVRAAKSRIACSVSCRVSASRPNGIGNLQGCGFRCDHGLRVPTLVQAWRDSSEQYGPTKGRSAPFSRLLTRPSAPARPGALSGSAGANAAVKVPALVAGMVAGADCIEDMDLLRHGGMNRLFGGVRAPSTLGTFLRAFTFGHVRQLDAVAARVLVRLAGRSPLLGGGSPVAFVDVDDTVKQTYGYAKQGAGYGYSGVKGLNALIATVSTPTNAPLIVATRLRKGSANSARGLPGPRAEQGELFTTYRFHACFADTPMTMVQAESQHRGHAIIEQVPAARAGRRTRSTLTRRCRARPAAARRPGTAGSRRSGRCGWCGAARSRPAPRWSPSSRARSSPVCQRAQPGSRQIQTKVPPRGRSGGGSDSPAALLHPHCQMSSRAGVDRPAPPMPPAAPSISVTDGDLIADSMTARRSCQGRPVSGRHSPGAAREANSGHDLRTLGFATGPVTSCPDGDGVEIVLRDLATDRIDVVVTGGGTGVSDRPHTRADPGGVLDCEILGSAEHLRAAGPR